MRGNKADKEVVKTPLDDKSKDKAQSSYKKSNDEVEMVRLGIERERLEIQKDIENSKLEIERLKLEREQKFWNRNSGTLITALVSLAAVIVSSGQVISTWISQNRQLQIAIIQKNQEIDMVERQKVKELALLDEQNRREWNLNAAKFIADNRKGLFDGSQQEQKLLAKVIRTVYPPDVAALLLEKLESTSLPSEGSTWREAREKIVRPVSSLKRVLGAATAQSADTARQNAANDLAQGVGILIKKDSGEMSVDESPENSRRSPQTNGSSTTVCLSTIEDAMMICRRVGEDANACHYKCYPK